MAGASGTFMLLIFQINILGFTISAVNSTNFADNIVAIPGGVYHYFKKGRMTLPVAWLVIVGTLPGMLIGYYLGIFYLPEPRAITFFVGMVLLSIGTRLLFELSERAKA